MTDSDLYNSIRDFVSVLDVKNEINWTELEIELQPGLVTFGGQVGLADDRIIPLDLKSIGKAKCNELAEQIQSFHKLMTEKGQNKWNKARLKINKSGQIDREFTWDEDLEKNEIDAYQTDGESLRPRWHWEEK